MFSLGDGTKFWLYTKPTDMRKSFNKLGGIVTNIMGGSLYSGDVFVFVNAPNNMMKLLRYEPGGLVIYSKRLDHGRMHLVERIQDGDPTVTALEWRRLVDTIQGIIDDTKTCRRKGIQYRLLQRGIVTDWGKLRTPPKYAAFRRA